MFKTGLLIGEQVTHAKTLLDSLYFNGVANDLSETGCGKTYVAVAVAEMMKRPVIVVCPKTVRNKWTKLMKLWGVHPKLVINYEKLVRGNTPWLKYNPAPKGPNGKPIKDYPRWCLTKLNFPDNALVILDEAHRCKAFSSLCAGLMIACKKQGYKLMNLSATLACDPRDMRAVGYANNLMRNYDNKSYKAFCIEHGAEWLGRWGALTFNPEDSRAQAKMKMIHESLFTIQKSASRLTRKIMAEYFPANHVDATAYSMDDISTRKIQAVYDWLERELDSLAEHCEKYGDCILTVILEARQRIELLKVPLFVELVEDAYDEGNSVVCFVNFTRTLEAISTKLNHRKNLKGLIGYIHGGQKDKDRERDVEDFQSDRKRIILANQAAGGVAIDLHDLNGKYPRESILSPDFSAIKLLQAMGRIHRHGALTPCYQTLAYVAGTIEERAVVKVQGKINNLSLLNDGDLSCGLKLIGIK
jgi:hypothetical protein